jgi:hypothetical protein
MYEWCFHIDLLALKAGHCKALDYGMYAID